MSTLSVKIEHCLQNIVKEIFKSYEPPLGNEYEEIYQYALFPAGKLFRSQLVWSVYADLKNIEIENLNLSSSKAHQIFSAAIECHHTYTLIHDDLPCMDNDDFRRGKLSTHKKYNEWKALLVGDGLLNLSYELISQIEHKNIIKVLQIFSKLLGPAGLIYGQYLDLSIKSHKFNFQHIKNVHALKTGKLFEVAIMGSYHLTGCNDKNTETQLSLAATRLGLIFQLLDDLTELSTIKNETHEYDINPWINYYTDSYECTIKNLSIIKESLAELPQLKITCDQYFQKIKVFLQANRSVLLKYFPKEDLDPLVSML